ncbi:unnamed protein product [Urochloa humidicola]
MDKLVTLFHGGTVKENELGGFEFENMHRLPLLFSARPMYSAIVDRVKERLMWTSEHVDVVIQGVIDVGSSNGPRIKRLISISGQDEWENYMAVVMASEVRALDLFVQKVYMESLHHDISLELNNSTAANDVVEPHDDDDVDRVGAAYDDYGLNDDEEAVPSSVTDPEPRIVCEASNRVDVDVHGDDETYEATRAVDSDDDRPVCPLSPDSLRILRRIFPSRDPLVFGIILARQNPRSEWFSSCCLVLYYSHFQRQP